MERPRCGSLLVSDWRPGKKMKKSDRLCQQFEGCSCQNLAVLRGTRHEARTRDEHRTKRIIASAMPTSLLFALLLHLFSCPKRGPKDRRAAGNMLRWLVSSRMPGRMVNLLYFRPDGTYSYKQAEIDEVDGTVPNAWPQDFSDFLARV